MSADLLRRAAKKLSASADAATPGPWSRYGNLSYSVFTEARYDHPDYEPPAVTHGSDREADAEYVVLLHPPVALAIAAWLEAEAESASRFELDTGLSGAVVLEAIGAVRVARALLREGSDG